LRALRRSLETFHGHQDGKAVAAAWQHLGNGDTFVRYAARLAIEWQPVAEWRARALAETSSPWASLTALLALARQGEPTDLGPVLESLWRIPFASLDPMQQVAWGRVHSLAFLRLGKPTGELRDRAIAQLLPLFPCGRERPDQELCGLLCALDAPAVVEKAMPLVLREGAPQPPVWADVVARNASYGGVIQRMMREMPPAPQIRLAYALRVVAHGWTLQQRESFFTFLKEARKKVGGASYGGYLSRIWQDAMATCTPAERAELAPVAGETLPTPPPFRATPPKGPGHDWQLDEAVAIAKRGLTGRDFQRGHNLFFATSCAACHRFAGEGGSMGPDLSSLGNKFGASDVLEAILQPSKVVSDQYAGVVLTKKDGTTLFGRFQRSKIDGKDVYTGILASADAKRLTIPADEVQRMETSKLSPMPTGLVTPLNESELLDLLAFLLSRGDDKSPMFAR
jgi:putative heme-binding domain-containing protein